MPQFDPATRTMMVRLEAENPGLALRPEMFVDVEVSVAYSPAITVPLEAVLDSGLRKTVFVERGEGRFEPREVRTGWRLGDKVEIGLLHEATMHLPGKLAGLPPAELAGLIKALPIRVAGLAPIARRAISRRLRRS